MNGERWTPTDDAQLRALAAKGYTNARIATEIGRTRLSTEKRASKLGVRMAKRLYNSTSDEQITQIQPAFAITDADAQAAARLVYRSVSDEDHQTLIFDVLGITKAALDIFRANQLPIAGSTQ